MELQALTYGQKAVGLSFNPSGDPTVQKVKELYAEIIDICDKRKYDPNGEQPDGVSPEQARLYSIAITEAQTAQMWAVKAITYKE